MNHVNAIRCNDEYQCSHCGKSWDIHEEAPDCKMTLVESCYKTVNYFGLELQVPLFAKYIATDRDGEAWCFDEEPQRNNRYWNLTSDSLNILSIGYVNLHGLNWRETLRKC